MKKHSLLIIAGGAIIGSQQNHHTKNTQLTDHDKEDLLAGNKPQGRDRRCGGRIRA
jgi:hypothetical protein